MKTGMDIKKQVYIYRRHGEGSGAFTDQGLDGEDPSRNCSTNFKTNSRGSLPCPWYTTGTVHAEFMTSPRSGLQIFVYQCVYRGDL